MEAHEIIDETMGRGEAERLHDADATNRSADLFNSYRRPPRCPENPFGTGNYSPLYYYMNYFGQRLGANPLGAIRMHYLLTRHVAARAAETDLRLVTDEDLKTLELTASDLAAETQNLYSRARDERRRREGSRLRLEATG